MKNFLNGTAQHSPNIAHTKVNNVNLPKSLSTEFAPSGSDSSDSRYMAGTAATKKPLSPSAPDAAAWIMLFSAGPKTPPLPSRGTWPRACYRNRATPKPKMAPKMLAENTKPVLSPR